MSGLLVDSQEAVLAQAITNLNGQTIQWTGGSFVFNLGGWTISVDQEPDLPDTAITFYGTEGKDDGNTQPDNQYQEHHGCQIRIRSLDRTGFTIANQLAIVCDQINYLTVAGALLSRSYVLYSVDRAGGVLSLGKEMPASRRNLYTLNVLVNVRMV